MQIEEIAEVINSLDTMLSERMKKHIHYRSMRNFVRHFDDIRAEKAREKILALMTEYIGEIRQVHFDFEGKTSVQLAGKYLPSISGYYRE